VPQTIIGEYKANIEASPAKSFTSQIDLAMAPDPSTSQLKTQKPPSMGGLHEPNFSDT